MTMLLIAGIAVLAAGLLAVAFGIPVKEFSFGNTLILAGAAAACTGVILLGLAVVVRELQNIARRLGPANPAECGARQKRTAACRWQARINRRPQTPDGAEPAGKQSPSASSPALAGRSRGAGSRARARRGRARSGAAGAGSGHQAAAQSAVFVVLAQGTRTRGGPPDAPATDPAPRRRSRRRHRKKPAPATFEDAWPQSDRARSDALRRTRTPSTFAEPNAAAPAPAPERAAPTVRSEEPAPVTVLKSGVVDGMAYSLYSDGSIEAQMPEGMMRFASIDELRSHLDQRP